MRNPKHPGYSLDIRRAARRWVFGEITDTAELLTELDDIREFWNATISEVADSFKREVDAMDAAKRIRDAWLAARDYADAQPVAEA